MSSTVSVLVLFFLKSLSYDDDPPFLQLVLHSFQLIPVGELSTSGLVSRRTSDRCTLARDATGVTTGVGALGGVRVCAAALTPVSMRLGLLTPPHISQYFRNSLFQVVHLLHTQDASTSGSSVFDFLFGPGWEALPMLASPL